MSIEHAYVTFVHDEETGMTSEVATLPLNAIADEGLAASLTVRYPGDFFGALHDLEDEQSSALELVEVGDLGKDLEGDVLRRLLASALTSRTVIEAQTRWFLREENSPLVSQFIDQILDTQVLVEHSDPAAMKASGLIGAAAATAEGSVCVALITAGHVAGVALLIASPVGIVVVGAGAAALAYRLLTRRRRKR